MASHNYPRAFDAMIQHEGSKYTDIAADRGGATKYGVTQDTLSRWLHRPATKAEVKALTLDAVKPIYKAFYANAVRFDELPSGIDFLAFDWAVNSGSSRAAKKLQQLVAIDDDGYIGPATIAAVNAAYRRDPIKLIRDYAGMREAFFRSIIKNDPSQVKFEKGWMRRIKEARALALQMAANNPPAVAVTAPAPKPVEPPKPKPAPQVAPAPVTPKPADVKPTQGQGWLAAILSIFRKGK